MYGRTTSNASILLLQYFSHFPVILRGQLKITCLIPMFFALLCFVQETWAQSTWYSKGSGNFNVTTNWAANPGGSGAAPLPSAFTSGTDNFVVQSTHTITINAAITINSLTVNGDVYASGGSLTLNGDLINNGTFAIDVPLTFSGANNATIGGANPIEVSGANITVNKSSGATLTAGSNTISLSGATLQISSGNFVAGSGEIEFSSGADLTISNGTGTVDFTTNQGVLAFIGGGSSTITADKDVTFFNVRNQKSGGSLNFTGTGGTRNFRVQSTYTRGNNTAASTIGTLSSATFGYTGDEATLEYAGSVSITIDDEWVLTAGLQPRNLTVNIGAANTLSGSTSYTIERNLTLTSGTINLGSNTLTVNGDITGSTVFPGSGQIADATTLNLGGGSASTQKQTISAGNITLNRLTVDKRFGSSPGDTEDPRNTVDVDGALNFSANGQLNIVSGTLRFLTDGRLAGSNLGTLTITIGSSTRRGVLRTGGTDITTGIVGTVDAQQGTSGVNSKVIYDGTTGSNTMRSGLFGIIEVRRDVQVQTNATTTVTSELIFNTGTISGTNTTNTFLVLRDGVSVTYTGSATAVTSYVNGPVRREISSTTPADFPVGKSGGGNRVTLTYQTAPSPVTVELEQFNSAPPAGALPSAIFQLSNTRHWTISFAAGSTSNAYRLDVDIAGGGIPSPLNRVLFRSGTSPDTYAGGLPTGADVDDDGTRATQAPNFPYTNFFTGLFTLGRSSGNLWISRTSGGGDWNVAATWEDAGGNPRSAPPSLAANSDVIIRNNRTVTISSAAEARSLTMDATGGAGTLVIQSTLDFSNAAGVQWLSQRTDFLAGTVEYQTGNVYADVYQNLVINGATGTANSGDTPAQTAITVNGNLTKQSATAFTSLSGNPISVAGSYTNTAGNATYNGGLTVSGNATVTVGDIGGSVTISGGTLTMNGGSFNVSGGTLTLNNGTSNTINGSLTSPVFNNLVFNIGTGSVTLGGSVSSVQVRGNFTLIDAGTGSSGMTNGRVIMNGSAAQSVLGSGSSPIENFEIDNSAGVTLSRSLRARNILYLTDGRLNTGTNVMSAAATSGGGPSSYVNGSLVLGGTGASYPKNYVVGDGSVYRPLQITTGPNATTLQRVRLVNSSPLSAGATPGSPLVSISAFRYWELTNEDATAAGTQAGDQVILGYVLNPVDDGINSLSPYPLRVAARSAPLAGAFSEYSGTDVTSFLGVRGVQSNTSLTSGLRFYTLGSINTSDAPLPVELISFTATSSRAGVVLNWATASERESAGFIINRRILSAGQTEWQKLDDYTRNPALVSKNSTNGAQYAFTDVSDLPAGAIVEYRLDEVSFNGVIECLREVRVETRFATVVSDFVLEQNYPNPFNPTTNIPYQLKERSKVTLEVYNALGQKVASLVDAVQERGNYAAMFNATTLASGMYFYRLKAQGGTQTFVQTKKMMLVK
ncbi:MAG: T9SS type A sorting domain-containing protein [Candidatus Thermochlorobacter sp.]